MKLVLESVTVFGDSGLLLRYNSHNDICGPCRMCVISTTLKKLLTAVVCTSPNDLQEVWLVPHVAVKKE